MIASFVYLRSYNFYWKFSGDNKVSFVISHNEKGEKVKKTFFLFMSFVKNYVGLILAYTIYLL